MSPAPDAGSGASLPGGVLIAQSGYRLVPDSTDLAYNHVHPVEPGHGGDADGGGALGPPPSEVPFVLEVPSPGDYRLFFDFAHEDAIHTAAFTVRVPAVGGAPGADAKPLDPVEVP